MTARRPDFASLFPSLASRDDAEWAENDRRIAEERRAEKALDDAKQRRRRFERMRAGGVPLRPLSVIDSDDFESDSVAIRSLEAIVDERGMDSIVVLAGGVGSGKTVAAVWWLARRDPSRPLFVTANKFESQSRYNGDFRTRWEAADALVLDDLGMEYMDGKGNFLANLDELIAHYHANLRGLVITTNLTAAAFKDRYSERIVSRIREAGRFVNIAGSDRRSGRESDQHPRRPGCIR